MSEETETAAETERDRESETEQQRQQTAALLMKYAEKGVKRGRRETYRQ